MEIKKIKDIIQEFSKVENDINPVFAQTQHDIIDLIDKYWMSRYANSDFNSLGDKKVFYNVVINPVIVAQKQTDLDSKEIKIIPEPHSRQADAEFMRKELNVWMEDNGFGMFLNNLGLRTPKYGTFVAKRVFDSEGKMRIKPVILSNLHVQHDVESIKDSFFVVEEHEMTPTQLRGMGWDEDAVESAILKSKKPRIKVYEYLDAKDTSGRDNYHIVADVDRGGITLWSANKKVGDIYKDTHWDKIDGRYLGRGQVELSFEEQIHLNRIENLKAEGLHWNSKYLFQTRDEGVNRNMLFDTDNGEILKVRSEISRVPVEERNLSAYTEAQNRWEFNLQRKTFSTDLTRGERPPAGTPLGSALLATQLSSNFFDLKREERAGFIKEVLFDWVIPQFKKEKKFAHTIQLEGINEEQQKLFDNILIQERLQQKVSKHVERELGWPDESAIALYKEQSRQEIKDPSNREKELPDNFYENLKFKIKIVITGESHDVQAEVNALTIALQNTQDPQERRRLINELMAITGRSPIFSTDEGGDELTDIVGDIQARGSAPRPPAMRGTPTPGVVKQTV